MIIVLIVAFLQVGNVVEVAYLINEGVRDERVDILSN